MATNSTPQTPQMLDPDTAYAVVYQRVYGPAFFEKLASDYNIRPNGEKQAMDMLTMAAKLRMAHDANVEKQAAASQDHLSTLHAHLDQQLGQMGVRFREEVSPVKQAAAAGSKDPELAHAILSMQLGTAAAEQNS